MTLHHSGRRLPILFGLTGLLGGCGSPADGPTRPRAARRVPPETPPRKARPKVQRKLKTLLQAGKPLSYPGALPNSGWTQVHRDYRQQVRLKKELLILPLHFHGFPTPHKAALEKALFAALLSTWGRLGVSLKPIERGFDAAGFGNLSWQLPHGAYHVVTAHASPRLDKDRCRPWSQPLQSYLPKFLRWARGGLRALGLTEPPGFQPRFLLSVHIDKLTTSHHSKKLRYRVLAFIVDAELGRVVAATTLQQRTPLHTASIVKQLAALPKWLHRAFTPVLKP